MSDTKRTAVICALDDGVLEKLAGDAGYEIVGMASTPFNAEHLVELTKPDLVLLDNAATGSSGVEEVRALREASPTSQVVLITTEEWTPSDIGGIGAFAVCTKAHLADLVGELGALDAFLEEAAEAEPDERRSGRDRRVKQEWAKVGWERRQGSRRWHAEQNGESA